MTDQTLLKHVKCGFFFLKVPVFTPGSNALADVRRDFSLRPYLPDRSCAPRAIAAPPALKWQITSTPYLGPPDVPERSCARGCPACWRHTRTPQSVARRRPRSSGFRCRAPGFPPRRWDGRLHGKQKMEEQL